MTKDIGHYLAVPEDQRLEVDPPPEYNADSGFDVQVVPDGEVRELSTTDPSERAFDNDEDHDDGSVGTPLQFVEAADPAINEYDEEND